MLRSIGWSWRWSAKHFLLVIFCKLPHPTERTSKNTQVQCRIQRLVPCSHYCCSKTGASICRWLLSSHSDKDSIAHDFSACARHQCTHTSKAFIYCSRPFRNFRQCHTFFLLNKKLSTGFVVQMSSLS